jgi:hypothetical protein
MRLNKYSYFAAIALLVFFMGCSGGKNSGMNSTPAETIEQFYNYLDHANIGDASQMVSRNAAANKGNFKNTPAEIAANIKARNGLKSVEVVKEDGNTLVANINYKNGTTETSTYTMVQEDRDWKIDTLK